MKKDVILITALAGLIGGVLFYLFAGKKKDFKLNIPPDAIPVEEIDGVIKLVDIVDWFKSLGLDSKNQTPFIAQGIRMHELINSFKGDSLETSVFVGVYNENSEEMSYCKIITGKAFDKRLSDVFSNATKDNPIIVLN
jgi:hypothetical protein